METLLLNAEDLMKTLRIGRSKTYELMATELPVVRIGRSVRVPAEQLRAWIERQAAEDGQGAESLP